VITAVIGVLLALAFYLGKRWLAASTENTVLRTQVAALKRQLSKR
jgi:hypothetical protein